MTAGPPPEGKNVKGMTTTMGLKSSSRSYNNRTVRRQATVSGLNVEELLSSHISSETGFGKDESILSNELQGNSIGDDRAVSVGNVGKWASVNEDWLAFQRL